MIRPWYISFVFCHESRKSEYVDCKQRMSGDSIMNGYAVLLLRHRLPSGGCGHGGATAVLDGMLRREITP